MCSGAKISSFGISDGPLCGAAAGTIIPQPGRVLSVAAQLDIFELPNKNSLNTIRSALNELLEVLLYPMLVAKLYFYQNIYIYIIYLYIFLCNKCIRSVT